MDYKRLDEILEYLKIGEEYKGYQNYNNYLENIKQRFDHKIDENKYKYYCSFLLQYGLVDYQISADNNNKHTYAINYKGIQLINSGKSTEDVHKEIIKKEELENKILEATLESHALTRLSTTIARQSTKLNQRQLCVTIILGIVSLVSLTSLFFQYEANKIAKENLEIAKKTYRLQLNNTSITEKSPVQIDTALNNSNKKQKLDVATSSSKK